MGEGYLLDSNTIIDYVGGKLPDGAMQKLTSIVNDGFSISPVVKIETLGFKGAEDDMRMVDGLLSFAFMHYIDDAVIDKTIELRKSYRIKLGDAIIAATAIVNNLSLLTHNLSDFVTIKELDVIDTYQL